MVAVAQTRDVVRHAVRSVLRRAPALRRDPSLREKLAERMERVSLAAAELIAVEDELTDEIGKRADAKAEAPALATAQAAGDIHRQTAVRSAADVLRATREAIDFPTFVTSLITGVFQAMSTSTLQQMQSYSDLLEAVGTSVSQFAASQITPALSAKWATERFPSLRASADARGQAKLSLASDAEMPDAKEIEQVLGATSHEAGAVDSEDLDGTLLPLIARKLARDRQSLLATMVLMGMQRVVVDEGRIHASMELVVDARSTAEQTQAERADARVTTDASGSFGIGAWGASARIAASVGYVKSDEQYTREDIAVRAGLRSSVDITFRTDQIPLDRMASKGAIDRLKDRAKVPEAERTQPSSLLTPDTRNTAKPKFDAAPDLKLPERVEVPNRKKKDEASAGDGTNAGDSSAGANKTAGDDKSNANQSGDAATTTQEGGG